MPPVADFSASPTSGIAPLTVAFSDLSVNNPTSWNWDFGDATTSSVQHPAHKYTAPGTYTVSLLAANEFGSDKMTKADYVTVELKRPPVTVVPPPSLPPVTDFSANITSGKTPLAVAFSDLSTNGPTGWAWDFGDGTSDTIEDPVHTYAAPGMYTVTLTTTNPYGSDPETKIDYIMVLPLGIPDADFTANTTSGYAPLGVLFTDRSAGSPTSWAWDFENDAVVDSTDKAPFHRYSAPGTYTVRLAVGSGDGNDEEVKVDYIVVRQDSTAVPEFPLYIFPFL